MPLDLSHFEKAIDSLRKALVAQANSAQLPGSAEYDLMRDGVIQRFEYTFELAWKTLKRYLEVYGLERVDGLTNRQLFRLGYEQGVIRDAEAWLEYLKSRNLTSYTYNEEMAKQVFEGAKAFLPDAKYLLATLS